MPALLTRAALLLGVSMLAGLGINAVRRDGVRFASFAPPALCAAGAGPGTGAAAATVTVVAPAEAVGLCGDPHTLVADVRAADAFALGHVTGALHLPCAAAGSVADAAAQLLAGRKTLIVYGDDTGDARLVAEQMRRRRRCDGVRVLVLEGGFPAWSQAGLSCSSGPCPDCQATRSAAP
jgi:rhodanese-related sulfurtransferase